MLVEQMSESGPRPSSVPEQTPGDDGLGRHEPGGGRSLRVLVLALARAAGPSRLRIGPSGFSAPAPGVAEKPQPLIRTGNQITVPERSPLRGRLAIAAVADRELRRDIVLPA